VPVVEPVVAPAKSTPTNSAAVDFKKQFGAQQQQQAKEQQLGAKEDKEDRMVSRKMGYPRVGVVTLKLDL
jgi:hypothetical protein